MKANPPEEVYDEIYKKYDEEELKQLGQLLDEHIDREKQDGSVQAPDDNKKEKDRQPLTVKKKWKNR